MANACRDPGEQSGHDVNPKPCCATRKAKASHNENNVLKASLRLTQMATQGMWFALHHRESWAQHFRCRQPARSACAHRRYAVQVILNRPPNWPRKCEKIFHVTLHASAQATIDYGNAVKEIMGDNDGLRIVLWVDPDIVRSLLDELAQGSDKTVHSRGVQAAALYRTVRHFVDTSECVDLLVDSLISMISEKSQRSSRNASDRSGDSGTNWRTSFASTCASPYHCVVQTG